MKLLFSEHTSDYTHYIFPYAIWAIPEDSDTPAHLFSRGFLPSSRDLDRFYMCRHVRVNLRLFQPSSENRRILRKGDKIEYRLVPKNQFNYSQKRKEFYKNYADSKFGKDVMTYERLDSLFQSKIITHLLLFTDTETKKEVGTVTLYLEKDILAYYYYAFYDLSYHSRNLGIFMMTSAVDHFARQHYKYIYLGTCYSRNALYKTQFIGAEFFNGFSWSDNLEELKYLINRDNQNIKKHLLEIDEYIEKFYGGEFKKISTESEFSFINAE